MITEEQLLSIAHDPQQQTLKQVKTYLQAHGVEFGQEQADDDRIFLRLTICPIKQRECSPPDRAHVIVFADGGIHAACHADKCDGKNWDDFQAAWGQTFDEWLATSGQKKAKKPKVDPVGWLVADALKTDKFFHWQGVGYVQTIRRGHLEVLKVREGSYKSILRLRFTEALKAIAKREWMSTAIEQLEANAIENGDEHPVYMRVGYFEGNAYIDLGDDARTIIEVTAEGWDTTSSCPVFFRRPKSMRPLPLPEVGGDLDLLRSLVNIAPEDFPLYVGFMVMVYHPTGPYPIMALIGAPGHAKTTTARDTRAFLDPSNVAAGGVQSNDSEDLFILAQDRRIVTFDNLNNITPRQSDDLCRLTTGSSHSRRTKYSDCDETTFVAKNPVIITSVKDVMGAADLIDRSIRFVLPKLAAVKDELVHDSEVTKAAPKVLGLILSGLSAAIKNLPETKMDNPPRMAGFALWATAAEKGLGLAEGSFIEAYRRNIGESVNSLLESDLAQSIINIADKGFKGRTKELAQRLGMEMNAHTCKELVGQLRHLQTALTTRGITIDVDRVSQGNKVIIIAKAA